MFARCSSFLEVTTSRCLIFRILIASHCDVWTWTPNQIIPRRRKQEHSAEWSPSSVSWTTTQEQTHFAPTVSYDVNLSSHSATSLTSQYPTWLHGQSTKWRCKWFIGTGSPGATHRRSAFAQWAPRPLRPVSVAGCTGPGFWSRLSWRITAGIAGAVGLVLKFPGSRTIWLKKKKSEKNIVLFVQLACLKNYPCGSGAQMSGSSHPKHFGSVSAPPAVHALRSPKSNSNKWLRSHAGVCFGEIVLSDQIRRALMLTASHSLETKISSSRFVFTPPVPSVPTYVTAEASRGRLVVRWRPPASPGGIVTSYSVECRCSRRNAFGLVTQTRRTSGT